MWCTYSRLFFCLYYCVVVLAVVLVSSCFAWLFVKYIVYWRSGLTWNVIMLFLLTLFNFEGGLIIIPASVMPDKLSLFVIFVSIFPTESTLKIWAGWRDWGPWSSCSVTCKHGKRTRQRECNRPKGHNHFCSQTENCSRGPCVGKNKMCLFFSTKSIVFTLLIDKKMFKYFLTSILPLFTLSIHSITGLE